MKLKNLINKLFGRSPDGDDWAARQQRVVRNTLAATAHGDIHLQSGRVITRARRQEMLDGVRYYDFQRASRF